MGGGGGARLLIHLWTNRQILYDLDCRDDQEKVLPTLIWSVDLYPSMTLAARRCNFSRWSLLTFPQLSRTLLQ